ncbi:hypothetical protein CVT24_009137 [Panaeolus cyanescens]|uniref:Phenazine biosynthesis protein n=1 Tax=Panaeolus cyanescens TaxID=181874 RepID=A0A409W3R4_9AGAR|nr:hypothetical protein CVT24_009137 [Panaeolus cyanescens]
MTSPPQGAGQTLKFTTLDVFTSERFAGNPLAIVQVPQTVRLSQETKQVIAREFNLSETVILHEPEDETAPVTIDIFMTDAELPFAGHPTVGSSWFLLSKRMNEETVTLRTKAGDILARREEEGKVRLRVPTNFKTHAPYQIDQIKAQQKALKSEDYVNGFDGAEPVASIVKGMTFLLLKVTSEDALGRFRSYAEHLHIPALGDWAKFIGVYIYFERPDGVIRTRMFDATLEDPATGSAASTLAGYLALQKGPGKWDFQLIQGVEMGRKSEINVWVEVGQDNQITSVELGGTAVSVMEGFITI